MIQTPAQASPLMALLGRPPRVLVVDDERTVRIGLEKLLRRSGYEVTTAESAEEALEHLRRTEFDVVMSDIRMNGLTGIDLLAQIQQIAPTTGVILMTGYASVDTAVEALRLRAYDYLTKPFDNDHVRATLERAVSKRVRTLQREAAIANLRATLQALDESGEFSLPGGAGRLAAAEPEVIERGGLRIDLRRRQVQRDGQAIDLTRTEFDLLACLARAPGEVLSCAELVRRLHGYDLEEYEARQVLRAHLSNLRRKIEPDPNQPRYLINLRGSGYTLAD
jgi:DNA-binding response OmpR family regulator